MDREELRRELQKRLRETHQRLFDLQGDAISGLREAIDAVSKTHDEMAILFRTDNDLDDLSGERR